jgi:hypothetical protein
MVTFRIGASCTYQAASQRHHVDEAELGANELQPGMEYTPLAWTEMGVAFDPPIRYRSYMPQLLQFCRLCHGPLNEYSLTILCSKVLTSIALPSDLMVTASLAHHLRTQWMENAMSDPCLFHATLFSASAAIDMLQGHQITTRTLYHQTWVIRLINQRLAQREPALTYGTLGAVIPLLYYNVSANDTNYIMWMDRQI